MDPRNDFRGGKPPVAPRTERRFKDGVPSSPGSRRSRDHAPKTEASGSSGGTSNRSTPSSVVVGSIALSRDLSDLSGSYHHGVAAGASSHAVPRLIYNDDGSSVSSLQKSWRQAYVLSSQPPDVVLSDISGMKDSKKPVICLDEDDSVELVRQTTNKPKSYDYTDSPRIPLLVLLMDANKKLYEILRIHVDSETDSVRDVLHSVRQNLPENWKQDYDGLLQIRSGVSSQLIHCLSLQHYDLQPFECWIAKPWSISAKSAGHLGENLFTHLKHIGVLADTKGSASEDDMIVQLSEGAASRIHEPHATFNHYHAKDFLTFSPPFESFQWKYRATADDQSQRSVQSTRSKGSSSLAAKLESLHEDDEFENEEESHEVQTVSSYSHLAFANVFESIKEEAAVDEQQLLPMLPNLMMFYSLEEPVKQHDDKLPSLNIKGFVGKLLGRSLTASSRSSGSSRSQDSLLVNSGAQFPSWDLTPMNSTSSVASFGSSKEDLSHYSSHQPLLTNRAPSVQKPSRFRRN